MVANWDDSLVSGDVRGGIISIPPVVAGQVVWGEEGQAPVLGAVASVAVSLSFGLIRRPAGSTRGGNNLPAFILCEDTKAFGSHPTLGDVGLLKLHDYCAAFALLSNVAVAE